MEEGKGPAAASLAGYYYVFSDATGVNCAAPEKIQYCMGVERVFSERQKRQV